MQSLLQQTEAGEFPITDVQDPNSFASRAREHWAQKQEITSKLPLSAAHDRMAETLPSRGSDSLAGEGKRLVRNVERTSPGDAATFSPGKTSERKELVKKKSHFYDDAFAVRESNTSARERVHRESMVMVEVRTNVIVNDEYTFITDLSHNLSSRYQRPESSILVALTHSSCLLLGGSFDPAYTMTITALPSQVQPVTNKRNTMILAKLLEESLDVPPFRGLIKFVGVEEENFAYNGKTCAAEIEDLSKHHGNDSTAIKRTSSRIGPKEATKRQSKRSMRNLKEGDLGASRAIDGREPLSPNVVHSGRLTPAQSEMGPSTEAPLTPLPRPDPFNTTYAIPIPSAPVNKTALDRRAEKIQKIGHRKSFMSGLFGKQNG